MTGKRSTARAIGASAILMLVAGGGLPGCGGVRPPADAPHEYTYDFIYSGSSPYWDRTFHVRRVLGDRDSGAPLVLLGRGLGPLGSDGAAAWLASTFWMGELPGAEGPLGRLYEAGPPGPEIPTFELALATAALAAAVEGREFGGHRKDGPPLAGKARRDVLGVLRALAATLAGRRQEDGTWGGPVETAWSLYAMVSATEQSAIVKEQAGDEWRRAGPAVLALWTGPEDPGLGVVDRLHRAAAVWLALRIAPEGTPSVGSVWFQRRFRGLDLGEDPDAWFAAGFLWMVLGPSADPDHPLQGCKTGIREAYLGGKIRTGSPGATMAYAAAIESFGWDAFGSVMGYLPVDDWPPLDGE